MEGVQSQMKEASSFGTEYDRSQLPDMLRVYYTWLFPYEHYYKWLCYGKYYKST